jgi:hypothetical protein
MSDNVIKLRTTPRVIGFGGLDAVNRNYVDKLLQLTGLLVFIGPNPGPPNPQVGQLWWRNDPDGDHYIFYDDGTSTQWVAAVPSSGGGATSPLVPIGLNPPPSPQPGQLWFRSNPDGAMFMWYDDGTSQQWI